MNCSKKKTTYNFVILCTCNTTLKRPYRWINKNFVLLIFFIAVFMKMEQANNDLRID